MRNVLAVLVLARGIKTLEKIYEKPAAKFWEDVKLREVAVQLLDSDSRQPLQRFGTRP